MKRISEKQRKYLKTIYRKMDILGQPNKFMFSYADGKNVRMDELRDILWKVISTQQYDETLEERMILDNLAKMYTAKDLFSVVEMTDDVAYDVDFLFE